ncbi:MAG: TIGR02206 family membrane protein [Bryobacteraceae bacterium]
MGLSGPLHLALVAAIVAIAAGLSMLCRRRPGTARAVRLALGWGLAGNELVWWVFRYSHEGVHLWNLPLQLCDLTVWLSVGACLTAIPWVVEFAYFAGLAGAGMALLTPDLWSPWPSYPAIYFFVAHGGIVTAVAVLVFGGICPLRAGAVWRAYRRLLGWAAVAGAFNFLAGTNYGYLRRKPSSASALDMLGPWPVYLLTGAIVALALFWLLWLPARAAARQASRHT